MESKRVTCQPFVRCADSKLNMLADKTNAAMCLTHCMVLARPESLVIVQVLVKKFRLFVLCVNDSEHTSYCVFTSLTTDGSWQLPLKTRFLHWIGWLKLAAQRDLMSLLFSVSACRESSPVHWSFQLCQMGSYCNSAAAPFIETICWRLQGKEMWWHSCLNTVFEQNIVHWSFQPWGMWCCCHSDTTTYIEASD